MGRRTDNNMSLPKFAIGMIFVIFAVALWSAIDTASFGMIILRAIICAIVLQVGYFIYVLGKVAMHSRAKSRGKAVEPVASGAKGKADLPLQRPLSR